MTNLQRKTNVGAEPAGTIILYSNKHLHFKLTNGKWLDLSWYDRYVAGGGEVKLSQTAYNKSEVLYRPLEVGQKVNFKDHAIPDGAVLKYVSSNERLFVTQEFVQYVDSTGHSIDESTREWWGSIPWIVEYLPGVD